jgi:hypothetical protein
MFKHPWLTKIGRPPRRRPTEEKEEDTHVDDPQTEAGPP